MSTDVSTLRLDDGQSFISLLDCPVCLETMKPPIMLCKNGHNICSKCRPRLPLCPTCRGDFTDIRNIIMEKMTNNLRLPCPNSEAGCPENTSMKTMENHIKICPFRLYDCVSGCSWKGRRFEILQHVKKQHVKNIHCKDKLRLCYTGFNFSTLYRYKGLLVACGGELFWQKSKRDPEKRKYFEVIQYIGPTENADKFKYEHQVCTVSGDQKICITNVTSSDSENEEQTYQSTKCFVIDFDMIKKYISDDKKFRYTLTMSKV